MSFSFGFPDWITGLFESGAEAAPAVADGLGDVAAALPGISDLGIGSTAGNLGGFGEAFQPAITTGAGDTLNLANSAAINPLAFSSTAPSAGENVFISTASDATIPTPPIPPEQNTSLAMAGGDPRNWIEKLSGTKPGADGLFGDVTSFLKDNQKWLLPAGAIGLGLARSAMSGQTPGLGAIKDIAGQQTATAKQLAGPLLRGEPLPSGLQAQIDQSKAANEAKIRQQYGSMGLSGSTMEAQALQQNEMAAAQAYTQQALSLYGASAQALGIANQADMTIMQDALMKDQQVAQLLGSIAAASMYGAMKS